MNQHSEGDKQKPEWIVPEGYSFDCDSTGRKSLTIPNEVFRSAGGQDIITRTIYAEVFDGAYASWGQDYGINGYCVELPRKIDQQTLTKFIESIEREADENEAQKRATAKTAETSNAGIGFESERMDSRKGFVAYLAKIFGK